MFRSSVRVDENTDADSTAQSVRSDALAQGLPESDADRLCAQLLEVLNPLVSRGRELGDLGSQVHIERKIQGGDYEVTVVLGVGERLSLMQRLARLIRRE